MIDLSDQREYKGESLVEREFAWLRVERFAGRDRSGHPYWQCRCKCGNVRFAPSHELKDGSAVSCGCYRKTKGIKRGSIAVRPDGTSNGSKEYHAWENMIQRCTNPNHPVWNRYGGRGITVCDRWRESFDAFLEDMGTAPSSRHTLGRKKNDLGYSKENCQWEVMADQCFNKSNNRILTLNSLSKPLTVWSKELGIPISTIRNRIIRGLSVEEALCPNYNRHRS